MNRSSSDPLTPSIQLRSHCMGCHQEPFVRPPSINAIWAVLHSPTAISSNKSQRSSSRWMNLYVASHDWNANNLKAEVSQRTFDALRLGRRWNEDCSCVGDIPEELVQFHVTVEEEYNLKFLSSCSLLFVFGAEMLLLLFDLISHHPHLMPCPLLCCAGTDSESFETGRAMRCTPIGSCTTVLCLGWRLCKFNVSISGKI